MAFNRCKDLIHLDTYAMGHFQPISQWMAMAAPADLSAAEVSHVSRIVMHVLRTLDLVMIEQGCLSGEYLPMFGWMMIEARVNSR